MYEQIAANRRRSALLIAGFILLVSAIGYVFGEFTGFGYGGVVIAVIVAILMTWGSYFYSDRIALAMSRAKPADPVQYARLHNIADGLAIAAGIPKPRVYVVEDEAPNAFATGRNPQHAAVAVTTGLINKMSRVELEGVMAHEMSHIRNHDILVTTIAVTLAGVVMLLSDWMMRGLFWGGGFRRRGGRDSSGGGAGPILAIVGLALMVLSPLIAQLMKAAVSRRRESLADITGVQLTRYPPGLASALRKLRDDTTVVRSASRATAHLWIESPLDRNRSWINRLFDTHPPLDERIRIIETL